MVSAVSEMRGPSIKGGAPTSVGRAKTGWRASWSANHSRIRALVWFAAAAWSAVTAAASARLRWL